MPVDYFLNESGAVPYVECLPDGGILASEQDALDLVAACGEYRTFLLMIHDANLPDTFFNLKTGLAGAVLLKFNNYRIRAAMIIPDEKARAGRFGEMVLEANRRDRLFHVFADREKAAAWLASD